MAKAVVPRPKYNKFITMCMVCIYNCHSCILKSCVLIGHGAHYHESSLKIKNINLKRRIGIVEST